MEDDTLLCDHLKIPHVACLVDPSYRFFNLMHSPYIIMTCDDQFSLQLLRERGFKRALFMPHAVESDLSPTLGKERSYEIVMLATLIDCEKRRQHWGKLFSANIRKRMEKVVSLALADDTTSFLTFIAQVFSDISLASPLEQTVYQEIELYIKGKDRLDLIQAIKHHQVHLFGNTPEDTSFISQTNVVIHPAVTYVEALSIMQKSKVVLNSGLKNICGAHERIFSAAACGAVVVTNNNPFLRQHMVNEEDLILYRRAHMDKINTTLNTILADEAKWHQMASRGRHKVMAHHTWDQRVQKLLTDLTPIIKKIRIASNQS